MKIILCLKLYYILNITKVVIDCMYIMVGNKCYLFIYLFIYTIYMNAHID